MHFPWAPAERANSQTNPAASDPATRETNGFDTISVVPVKIQIRLDFYTFSEFILFFSRIHA
jgi:hypothetical protein